MQVRFTYGVSLRPVLYLGVVMGVGGFAAPASAQVLHDRLLTPQPGPSALLATSSVEAGVEDVGLSPEVASREVRECDVRDDLPQTRSVWATNLWPQGRVPYTFDSNTTASEQNAMRLAMDVIEGVANIRFVPRNGETAYIRIADSTGNNSSVGRTGSVQVINIFNWNVRYIMCHELMHALGIWHEQSRPDRGTYVTINTANICQTCCSGGSCTHNFNIRSGAPVVGAYDFESVMHYNDTSFSTNGQPTIVCTPEYAQFQNVMGQRNRLSAGDIAGLVNRYGPPCTAAAIASNPASITSCVGGTATLSAQIAGSTPQTLRWEALLGGSGSWTQLSDGAAASIGTVAGATTSQIQITLAAGYIERTQFRLTATNACTTTPIATQPATLSSCIANRNADGGVDVNDLLLYLEAFEAGSAAADLGATETDCTPNGAVDVSDLLNFLGRFEAGC